jgi:hypothetical protein
MSLRSLLRDTCTIKRPTSAANATSGYPQSTFAVAAEDVPFTLQANSSSEGRQLARDTGRTQFWAFFLIETSIKTQDRIIPDGGVYVNRVLSVTGPPQDEAGRQNHFRVPCELLEGGGSL